MSARPASMYPAYKNPSFPGLVHLPGVNQRDPISGVVRPYASMYANPSEEKGRTKFSYAHKNVHEKSFFESTGSYRSYFIIHPQFVSENIGAKRLSLRERGYHSWDNKPAFPVQPTMRSRHVTSQDLINMKKEKERSDLLQENIDAQKRYEGQMSAPNPVNIQNVTSSRYSQRKPMTPKDRNGNALKYTIY